MEGILLVICCKLNEESDNRGESKQIVRIREGCVRLQNSSSVGREAQRKKEDILDDRNENKVDDLKEEGRYTLAQHVPTIIFVTTKLE